MKDILKEIRKQLKINQDQFASLLGVSPVTVNRWENEKVIPSIMAQNQIYDICRNHHINLTEFIVSQENSDKLLYHASHSGIDGTIQPISRNKCDFGKGFYMGTNPLQPLTLVCNSENPVFYTLHLNESTLKILEVNVGIDWAMLIAYFRGYMENYKTSPLYTKYEHMTDGYDVIRGYIADDRMYQVLNDFFERRITDTALIACLSALDLGVQYVAKTQKACDQITIMKERPLQKLELLALSDTSEVRRKKGISLAEEITINHRRDGRYFDEIMKGIQI